MGKIITFDANARNKKKNIFLKGKTETPCDDTYPRLDKTEKSSYEKACKLAGKDPVARSIILCILDYASPMGDATMEFINTLGVYDKRIPLLFWTCDSDPYKFIHMINSFFLLKIPREEIIGVTTKHGFLNIISKYEVEKAKYKYEYYDDGG